MAGTGADLAGALAFHPPVEDGILLRREPGDAGGFFQEIIFIIKAFLESALRLAVQRQLLTTLVALRGPEAVELAPADEAHRVAGEAWILPRVVAGEAF